MNNDKYIYRKENTDNTIKQFKIKMAHLNNLTLHNITLDYDY